MGINTEDIKVGSVVRVAEKGNLFYGMEGMVLCLGIEPINYHVTAVVEFYEDHYIFEAYPWDGEPKLDKRVGIISACDLDPIDALSDKTMVIKLFGNSRFKITDFSSEKKFCGISGCDELAVGRAFVNIRGNICILPACQKHYKLNHGMCADDFRR